MPDETQSYYQPGPGTSLHDAGSNLAKAQALSDILKFGLISGAVGVGGRALVGLPDFIRRQTAPPPTIPRRQSQIRVPIPIVKEGEDGVFDRAGKALAVPFGLATKNFRDWGPLRTAIMTHRPDGDMINMPWATMGATAATAGGLYGGWKLTDHLMNKAKGKEQTDELEAAKQRYQQAMLMSYDKVAADGGEPEAPRPFEGLDRLYAMTKEADGGILKSIANNPYFGNYASMVGLASLGAGIGTGVLSYRAARKDNEHSAIEEAVRRRQEMLASANPLPIEAVPAPYYVHPDERAKIQRRLAALDAPQGRAKAANVGQAASQALGRLQARQAALWKQQQIQMGNNPDGGAGRGGAGGKPAAPQLPTMAGAITRIASQPR